MHMVMGVNLSVLKYELLYMKIGSVSISGNFTHSQLNL